MKFLRKRILLILLTSIFASVAANAGMMGFPTIDDYQERAHQYGVELVVPDFPTSIEEIESTTAEILAEINTLGDSIAMLEVNELTFENTFQAMDVGTALIYNRVLPINIVMNTSQDAEMRKFASDTMRKFRAANIEFNYREDVYHSLKAFADSNPELSDIDQRLVDEVMAEYRRLGYELAIEERARVEAMQKELSSLRYDFRENIREAKYELHFTKEALDGVPESFLNSIVDEEGMYVVRPNVTNHISQTLKFAKNADTREKIYLARTSRAKEVNIPILQEMVTKRNQIGTALGYKTWADYRTENRMAGSGQRAQDFLEDLVIKLEPKFQQEMADLLAAKKEETGLEAIEIQPWDIAYYQEQLNQKQFQLDTEKLRQFFPYEKCIDGMFTIFETVFDIEIEEIENPTIWDPNVALYAVSDATTEKPLGLFYVDPFPREGKYNHFAKFTIIPGLELPDGTYQRSTVALICNFAPPEEGKPSLLTFSQVKTLFHEFGHAMHSILSEVKYSRFSGTSVPRDFVETPSQILEYWLGEKDVLDLFAAHWQEQSEKLPAEWVESIKQADIANAGYRYRRQLTYGLIDMAMHHCEDVSDIVDDLVGLSNEIAARTTIAFPEGTAFIAAFGHLSNYDAGYYGYAWADVIAADMAAQFQATEDGFMDRETGFKLRKTIFETGNSKDVNLSLRDFLGRDPEMDAFIRALGIESIEASDT
jgi:thimet oligopeptidase